MNFFFGMHVMLSIWWSSHFQWSRNSLLPFNANHPFPQNISWMKHLWFNIFFDQVGWFDFSNMAFKSLIPCLMNRWNCNMGNHPWIYVWIRLSLGKSTWFRRSKKSNKGFNPKLHFLSLIFHSLLLCVLLWKKWYFSKYINRTLK